MSDSSDAEEDPVVVKVIPRPSTLATIIAYWMVLDVGKDSVVRVCPGIATGFRTTAYNPIGDCACSFAALTTLYAVAQVILFLICKRHLRTHPLCTLPPLLWPTTA